jgi:hypothetical protein
MIENTKMAESIFTEVHSQPLSLDDFRNLDSQLQKRLAVLFLRYGVYLQIDCLNWEEAVLNLAHALAEKHAKFLAPIILNEDCGSTWKMAMALATEFFDGFKIAAELTSSDGIYKHHEIELTNKFREIKHMTQLSDKNICALLENWNSIRPLLDEWNATGRKQVPDDLKTKFAGYRGQIETVERNKKLASLLDRIQDTRPLIEIFQQSTMSEPTGNLHRRLKEVKQRMKTKAELVLHEFTAGRGYSREQVQMILDTVPASQEKKKMIAYWCEMNKLSEARKRNMMTNSLVNAS